jgi:acyl dehydratase
MIKIGQKASLQKRFTAQEVVNFSALSMDENLIHTDSEYAKSTRFGQCIVQGPFVESMIGGILGSQLPGSGTIYLSHETKFVKPVFINELVTANVEVTDIKPQKNIITLRTWVEKENGELAIDGSAVVMYLKDNL